ncbi:MAG: lysine 5,6-aminomutase reactivase subunit KamB [Promethearchaeota archaeon]
MIEYLKKFCNCNIISIIGLAKNVSKTTTLNYIIRNIEDKITLGLTSIGRDGEKYDVITELPKPKIYIKRKTYVVTAKQCFEESTITFDLIKNTGFNTPLGEILILKAQSEGYIELAGPSINSQLSKICSDLKNLGCDLILVDGAFDRRSYATPLISDASILSTGASVSSNMKEVIDVTIHTIKLLGLEHEKDEEIIKLTEEILKKSKVGIITKEHSLEILNITTALDSVDDIIKNLNHNSEYVVINGAITDKLLEGFMKNTEKYKEITLLVEDGTKLFLTRKTMSKFLKKGGTLKVLNPINIIAVTINPTSPDGYEFNKDRFLELIQERLAIPVYNLGVND